MIPLDSLRMERIAVLCGGTSCEREVSLRSGKAVMEALVFKGLTPVQVDAVGSFLKKLKLSEVTVVFLAMHGTFGEDGELQELLEAEGIPYTGSGPEASRLAFDKALSYEVFKQNGLKIPQQQVFLSQKKAHVTDGFSYPLVVKPARCGSSLGVSLVEDPDEMMAALRRAFEFDGKVLVEEYVRGREMTVAVVGETVLPVVEIIPKRKFYDYTAKYDQAGTVYQVPARLSKTLSGRLREVALKAHTVLGCRDVSRVDFLLPETEEGVLLEVNTLPGMTDRSLLPMAARAAGIEFADLCLQILRKALNRKRVRSEVRQ